MIAVRHAQTGEYELYATNARPDKLPVKHVRATYRLRWVVETFFKLAKSGCGMSELPSSQESIVPDRGTSSSHPLHACQGGETTTPHWARVGSRDGTASFLGGVTTLASTHDAAS